MAHFAKLDSNNTVLEVNVVNNEVLDVDNEEASGVTFLTEWSGGHSDWKQTSYNSTFRKNFAGIGYTYDETRDAFIAPKPFESWLLDEESCTWRAPTPYPTDGLMYQWAEDDLNWQTITFE
jgi:hypothetical protein